MRQRGLIMTEQIPFEQQIRALLDAGQRDEAVRRIVVRYNRRLADFFQSKVRDLALTDDLLQEVYAQLLTQLEAWRGGSLQAWLLRIARTAWSRHFRDPGHRREGRARLSDHPELAADLARARTETMHHLRTSVRADVRALWSEFTAEEQRLLRLRLDERLTWPDIVVRLDGEGLDPATARRRAQTLRKRFERLKGQLAQLAQRAGLGPDAPADPPR